MNSVSANKQKNTTDELLNAKVGRTFITPTGEKYQFDWYKVGRKYIYILIYNGKKCEMKPTDFNTMDIDNLIQQMKAVNT